MSTNAQTLLAKLERAEVDGSRAPDCRQVLQAERFTLLSALRSKDAARIASAVVEAERVLRMWEGIPK